MNERLGWALTLGAWLATAWAGAAVTQDWKDLGPGFAGTYADKDGSTITIGPLDGAKPGEKGLSVKAHIIGWAGVWTTFKGDLSGAGSIRFRAKASHPEILQIGLVDDRSIQYTALFRLDGEDWKEFTIPLSQFRKGAYQMPEAPKGQPIDWTKIMSLQFAPQTHGEADLQVGPVAFVKGKAKAETGIPDDKDKFTVQDFIFLDKTAYGPFTDGKSGTTIGLSLDKDPDVKGGRLVAFQYQLKPGGWGGCWMRAGDAWGGQDWTGAKAFTLEVFSAEPIQLQIGFNDGNPNAYIAKTAMTQGKGWERLSIPFQEFQLNPYYQPPEAKKGSPQDLSHVESINIAPLTEGKHDFKVRRIMLEK